MMLHQYTAFAIAGELDLNKLASQLGILRKYRWEEPMQLDPKTLRSVSAETPLPEAHVYLYYFGGVVFRNCSQDLIKEFSAKIEQISDIFKSFPNIRYREQYSLRVEEGGTLTIANDCAVVPRHERAFVDIVAFVLAKSVALERIEEQADTVLDEMEDIIALLDIGKLGISDKKLAALASKILNFKYRSIAFIMVLEKPDITWDNPEADRLYLTMATVFELSQRYQEIKHKSETLMDITQVFSDLSHARRSTRLEWIIIALIFIEIVIYLFQILR
jgi:required for meiotic nuclear division protein 1